MVSGWRDLKQQLVQSVTVRPASGNSRRAMVQQGRLAGSCMVVGMIGPLLSAPR